MEVKEAIQKNEQISTDYGLVSVIMPTYKQENSLHVAVKSILSQSYSNIELIVIDDNKDESYRNSNKKYFENLNNSKIKYVQNENNLGSAGSRNKGIFMSEGKYITFLDDDDYYDKYKIEKQVEKMHKENADVSVCNLILLNEKGKVIDQRKRKYLKRNEPVNTAHLKYHITGTDTMMYKSDFIKSIGGFDTLDFGDEFYLMYKALQKNPKFVHVDYDGAYAVVHTQTGLSSGDNKIKTEEYLIEFKKAHFQGLKKKDIRYIKMRHNTVLAVAHKKNKSYGKTIKCLLKAFFLCPIGMFKLYIGADR